MKILVTGAAGFIGYHLCEALIKLNHSVVGLDNINDYYSVDLKYDRLKQLGIVTEKAGKFHQISKSSIHGEQFQFIRMNLEDRDKLPALFKNENFGIVCNLAAQAGVRYSLENPESYINSNVVGFLNILECCKKFSIKHLLYASSSSVYGLNKKIPFETSDRTDQPISLYANAVQNTIEALDQSSPDFDNQVAQISGSVTPMFYLIFGVVGGILIGTLISVIMPFLLRKSGD